MLIMKDYCPLYGLQNLVFSVLWEAVVLVFNFFVSFLSTYADCLIRLGKCPSATSLSMQFDGIGIHPMF